MKSLFELSVAILVLIASNLVDNKVFGQTMEDDEKFSLDAFKQPVRQNLTIDYNNYENVIIQQAPDSTKEHWVEYKTNLVGYYTISDNNGTRSIFFTLLENKVNEKHSEFTLLKFVPNVPLDSSKEYSYFHLHDFSGTIYGFNKLGEMEYVVGVTEGRVKDIREVE